MKRGQEEVLGSRNSEAPPLKKRKGGRGGGGGKKGKKGAGKNGSEKGLAVHFCSADGLPRDASTEVRAHVKCRPLCVGRTASDVWEALTADVLGKLLITEQNLTALPRDDSTSITAEESSTSSCSASAGSEIGARAARHLGVVEVFKKVGWDYCFVALRSEKSRDALIAALDGAAVKVKENSEAEETNIASPSAESGELEMSSAVVECKPASARNTETAASAEKNQNKSEETSPPPAEQVSLNRFGLRSDCAHSLVEVRQKLKNWGSTKEAVSLLDKTCPLYSTYDYAAQVRMKDAFTRTTARTWSRRMRQECEAKGYEVPVWADATRSNCGCAVDALVECEERVRRLGYRNKVEFSIGVAEEFALKEMREGGGGELAEVARDGNTNASATPENTADSTTSSERSSASSHSLVARARRERENPAEVGVGFVSRMLPTNEQAIGAVELQFPAEEKVGGAVNINGINSASTSSTGNSCTSSEQPTTSTSNNALPKELAVPNELDSKNRLPHVSEVLHRVSKLLKRAVLESGLPVYRRHRDRRDGFWRLCVCRVGSCASNSSPGGSSPPSAEEEDPSRAPVLLMISTTTIEDAAVIRHVRDVLLDVFRVSKEGEGSRSSRSSPSSSEEEGVNVVSIYWQFNDALSDAVDSSVANSAVDRGFWVGAAGEEGDADSASKRNADSASQVENCLALQKRIPLPDSTIEAFLQKEQTQKPDFESAHKRPTKMLHIFGKPGLPMRLCGLRFEVGPLSFFQTNTAMTEKLYAQVVKWALEGTTRVGGSPSDNELKLKSTDGRRDLQAENQKDDNVEKKSLQNLRTSESSLILDVCSGVGTIGCAVAAACASAASSKDDASSAAEAARNESTNVVGVELVAEAVASANENAALNGLGEKCHFLCGKAEETLPRLFRWLEKSSCSENQNQSSPPEELAGKNSPEEETSENESFPPAGLKKLFAGISKENDAKKITAIVDPPRVGLHAQVCRALRENEKIDRLVYVSCNPESLTEDIIKLCHPSGSEKDRFVPVRCVSFDMFPHTVHLEMVAYLERWDPARHMDVVGYWGGEAVWVGREKGGERSRRQTGRGGGAVEGGSGASA